MMLMVVVANNVEFFPHAYKLYVIKFNNIKIDVINLVSLSKKYNWLRRKFYLKAVLN